MCLYLFWDCVILYYSASRYHSHVFILIAGWIQAVSHKKYHLISGNSLQLITIADDDKDKCDYMQVRYYLVSEGEGLVERSLEIENEYLTGGGPTQFISTFTHKFPKLSLIPLELN